MTVLIVDDARVMRKVTARALRLAELEIEEVLEAANGLEALELLRARDLNAAKLKLILCDINMPVMDGLQFIERMRAEGLMAGVPIVMITTEGNESHVRRALEFGASGYLRKPFTTEQLKASVERLLDTA